MLKITIFIFQLFTEMPLTQPRFFLNQEQKYIFNVHEQLCKKNIGNYVKKKTNSCC